MHYNTIILQNSIATVRKYLREFKGCVSKNGNVFAIVSNEYAESGDVATDFFDLVEYGCSIGYQYVNTIVFPKQETQRVSFVDNIGYIVWFAVDKKEQFFDKDAIRESHIWQHVEWGKREKNYNPKGKDPGNVWIPTVDDGKGHITDHILMSLGDILRRITASTLSRTGKGFLLIGSEKSAGDFSDPRFDVDVVPADYAGVRTEAERHDPLMTICTPGVESRIVFSSSESMREVENGSVDVVITSPPYWNLKDYFKQGQIGQEAYAEYLVRMEKVWRECHKKLSPNGSMWININIRVSNNKTILIPRDFVAQCKRLGFYYKGVLIWHKSSGIPTHSKNLVDRHEYVLIFSKSPKLTVDENLLRTYSDYKNPKINGKAIWNINRKAGSVGKKYIHPAIYPNELVARIIAATTCENQVVLDPFLGSGTTLIASENLHRMCIGYEFNEGFEELILDRISKEAPNLKPGKDFQIIRS